MSISRRTLLLGSAWLLLGCTPRDERQLNEAIVLREARGCVVQILLDLSGSFQDKMTDNGKAYQFCIAVIDEYFRTRLGENDELIIAQISGSRRTLLFQGTPTQLRTDFGSPEEFGEFLRSHANPAQSLVFANMAQGIEYLSSDIDVASGRASSLILVLSDLDDNDPDQEKARLRLRDSLVAYSKVNGIVGCYFVDQHRVAEFRQFISSTGIKRFVVEGDFIGHPQLPRID